MACLRRPADAHAGHRDDTLGQFQEIAHLRGMVADDADWTAAEPDRFGRTDEGCEHDAGIDGGVEELVEMVVRKRFFAELGNALEPPAIGEKDQKHRRGRHPGHVRDQVADGAAAGRVGDDEDVALLQVALGRRRERAGAQ